MTAKEVADMLCLDPLRVASVITSARYDFPGRYFRSAAYRHVKGRRARREYVFDIGEGPDAEFVAVNEVTRRRKIQADFRKRHAARINAQQRARRASAKGKTVVNPWTQLADPTLHTYMARVAANTTIREAA